MVTCSLLGTCGKNDWRDGLIGRLVARGVAREQLFNPVVPDWTEAAQAEEERHKKEDEVLFFFISDPMDGTLPISAHSLVEAVIAAFESPRRVAICFDMVGQMPAHVAKVYRKTRVDIEKRYPVRMFDGLGEAEDWLLERLTAKQG